MFYLLIFPAICIIIIIGLMIALIVDAIRKSRRCSLRFSVPGTLMSEAEFAVFHRLQASAPKNVWICPKVNLTDVVRMDNLDPVSHAEEIAEVYAMKLDFVAMDAKTSRVLGAIEIDRGAPDSKVKESVRDALIRAGIECVRFAKASEFDPAHLTFMAPINPDDQSDQSDQFAA